MFFGWRMVAVSFLTNFISVGFVFYSYGVFFKALSNEFGGSRLGVSLGLTCANATAAVLSPAVGRWLDRGGIRISMAVGAALMGLAFIIGAAITALWQFYLVFGLVMGTGVCLLGALPSSTLIANWFVSRRGAALGLATIGVSLSGVLMPPIGTALIARYGFRVTFLIYATAALGLVVPAILRWVVARPEDMGKAPYGIALPAEDDPHGAAGAAAYEASAPAPSPMGQRNFWLIAAITGLNFCTLGAVLTHAVPHVTDLGYSAQQAAWVLSTMATAGACGKPLFGAVTDRVDKRAAFLLSTGLQLVGLGLFVRSDAYQALLLGGAVFGLGMGGVVPLHGALIGATFGRRAFGRVMGTMTPVMTPLSMTGVPLAGYLFDRTGSYDLAFHGLMGAYVVAIALLSLLRLPAVEPGTQVGEGAGLPLAAR